MLQQMRGYAKSWIAYLFVIPLIVSFGIWGIGDLLRGSSSDTSLATVGDFKIQPQLFERDYRNMLRRLSRQEHHDVGNDEAHARGIDRRVLESEISDAALDQSAKKYGLVASDAQVSTAIRSMGGFRNALGAFDHATMVQVLSQNNLSENEFIDMVRGDLTRNQLLSAASDGLEVPPGYAKLFFDYINERRAAEYIEVPASAIASVPSPTDAQLSGYLKAHASDFSTPEYRDITYLAIGPDDVANQVKVSDADLKQRYEQLKDQYLIPEKRDVAQLTFPDEASAKAARGKIDAGTTFDDVAKSLGKSPADIELGTVAQADLGTDRGPPAFALPEGGTTQAVKFTFGWVILHVVKITPAVNKSFDDVKETLLKQAFDQLAAAKITDITNAFEDARAGGASFTDAAAKVGMKAVRISAVDKKGLAPDGSKTNLPPAQEFQSQMARADVGEEGDPFQTADGHAYAIKINGVTPSKLKPLDAVRAQVTTQWTAEQRRLALAKLAAQLVAKANAQRNLGRIASEVRASVQTTGALTHQTKTDTFSPALVSKIFSAEAGTAVSAPSPRGDSYIVARVTGVTHPGIPAGNPLLRQFGTEIGDEAGNDLGLAFAASWRDSLGVKINQSQVDRVAGGGS